MKVHIRKWRLSDIDNLVLYANNKRVSDNLSDAFPFPYTKDFGLDFIKKVSSANPTKVFAITVNDEAIGSIGIFPDEDIYRKNAAIAYWIGEPYWGRGITTQAIKQVLPYAFKELGMNRVYAKPFGSNINSHKVLEKAGFHLEATLSEVVLKNNEYLDEKIYSLTRQTFLLSEE